MASPSMMKGLDRRSLVGKNLIPCSPVVPSPGQQADAVFVLDQLRAVAVELYFMNPVVILWRVIDKLRLHRLDGLQTHELTHTRNSISFS